MTRPIGISLATAAMSAAAIAQPLSPFNTQDCLERTAYRWCPSKASAEGWKLKYEGTNPDGMMDSSWRIEIWVRGRDVMQCEFRGGRAGIRVNSCEQLHEVSVR